MPAFNMSVLRLNRVDVGKNPPIKIQRKLELQIELESKIRKLQAEYQQRLEEYENIDAKLQHHAASVTPIKTIPKEILSEIFLQVVGKSKTKGENMERATLTSVCKDWYEVASGNPLLWNRIDVKLYKEPLKTYKQLEYIDLFLARSKDTLLDIDISVGHGYLSEGWIFQEGYSIVENYFNGSSHRAVDLQMLRWIRQHIAAVPAPNRHPDILTQIFIKLIGPNGKNMSRWRALYLLLDDERLDHYLSLFKGVAPNLKLLSIELTHEMGLRGYRFLYGKGMSGAFPSMESVEGFRLNGLVSPSHFRLNAEVITSLEAFETPQLDTITFISSLVNLQTLVYKARRETGVPTPKRLAQLSTIQIHLPMLESLEFLGPHTPFVFSVFDVPRISKLTICPYLGSVTARPTGRLFQYPSIIFLIWPSIVSERDGIPILREFLMQCTSATIIDARTIDRSCRSSVVRAVEQCRAIPHGLPNLEGLIFAHDDILTKDLIPTRKYRPRQPPNA